jgi:dihydrofolate reductase
MKPFKAIAAMSENRVIGCNGAIPWHLPEDFRWFKRMTTGNVIVMGRKTFQSIGKPLPNRETVVLSRSGFTFPGIRTVVDLNEIANDPAFQSREVFLCGGAEIYALGLPRCSDLYLSLVALHSDGDTFFPPFEDQFQFVEVVAEFPEFKILHYQNRSVSPGGSIENSPLF